VMDEAATDPQRAGDGRFGLLGLQYMPE
jgi:hypothetical protein